MIIVSRMPSRIHAASSSSVLITQKKGWEVAGVKGAGMLLQGELNQAAAAAPERSRRLPGLRPELTLPFQLSTLGDAYTQAGRFEDARQALDEGLAIVEKNDERCQEAELHRLKGELLLAESPDHASAAAAEDCFRGAIETARRQQSKAWELRAAMSLARLWQRQDRPGDARQILVPIYATYTEGWTTPDLAEARELLESLA